MEDQKKDRPTVTRTKIEKQKSVLLQPEANDQVDEEEIAAALVDSSSIEFVAQ